MAVYCAKCGAEMNEKDVFCGTCGAPVAKAGSKGGSAGKGAGTDAKNYRMIGIAVIAVAVLVIGGFVLKGIGGWKAGSGDGSGEIMVAGDEAAEDEVLTHLRPWMGEWMLNYKADPSQPLSISKGHEGYYHGHILTMGNSNGAVHVNEQYIDFSDFTKDQKDCFLVSALTYYESDYGADVFEDEDSGRRILFYKHFELSKDYGEVMRIEAYVGTVESEIYYIGSAPIAANHNPDSDGWAADYSLAFIKVDE